MSVSDMLFTVVPMLKIQHCMTVLNEYSEKFYIAPSQLPVNCLLNCIVKHYY